MQTKPTVIFLFSGSVNSLLKYKKFFKLGARKFHFLKYRNILRVGFVLFIFGLEKLLLEI